MTNKKRGMSIEGLPTLLHMTMLATFAANSQLSSSLSHLSHGYSHPVNLPKHVTIF